MPKKRHCLPALMGASCAGLALQTFLSIPAAAGEQHVGWGWLIFSRSCAPAGAQESSTFHPSLLPRRRLWTASAHYNADGDLLHIINTYPKAPQARGWEFTWRSYAGHLASEFWWGIVVGYHYGWNGNGKEVYLGGTRATDCNILLPVRHP